MALIKCPECEHEVSDSAMACPNCGFTLRKEINTQKRASFFSKYKAIIIGLISVGVIIGINGYSQASRPGCYIKDFMAVYETSKSDWELSFGSSSGSYGVYSWDNVQLIEDINGELELITYSPELKYWKWDVIGDSNTLSKIKRGLTRLSTTSSSVSLDDYDECYKYKWVPFTEENTGIDDWTIDDKPITMEMYKGEYHDILLLTKGNKIEIQYVPFNKYSSWNTRWYDMD